MDMTDAELELEVDISVVVALAMADVDFQVEHVGVESSRIGTFGCDTP